MTMCFIWLRSKSIWAQPALHPQVVDSDVLDYQLSNPNEQARPDIVARYKLTEAECTMYTLKDFIERYPSP